MAWAKVDDQWFAHRKVVGLSLAARGLWTTVLSWSCAQRSPEVPAHMVAFLAAGADVEPLTAELVSAGLWTVDGAGWRIHDWHEYQERSSEKAAGSGTYGNHVRWHTNRGVVEPDCEHCTTEHPPDDRGESPPISPPDPDGSRDPIAPVPSRPDPSGGGARGTSTWTALARHTDATRWAELSASKPQLLQALADVEAAGWKPDTAAKALLASLNGAKHVSAVVLTRARALADAPPDLPGPKAADCTDCAGTGLLWLDDGRTATQCTHQAAA